MLLGDLLIWYYENMAGIKSNSETPGFKQIIMKPGFNAGLTYVNASYESIYGTIKSDWKKDKKALVWNITIPANTSAIVYLPATDISAISINKQKLDKTSYTYSVEKNQIIVTLSSGNFAISVK
ncbi:Bacterial alpha-L-rhamnosidase [compost metagenome]